jgi:phenylpropionate dioxygenase-like ring-hydroxylating dioxygenase large terminal subunit
VIDGLLQPGRVHRRAYTDPAIFELEMRRVFGGTWTYIGHESEVPQPGDWIRKQLGRRPLLLVRGRDQQVRALFNRCTHRGSMLERESRGTTRRFTCPYHGWSFDTEGALCAVPVPASYDDMPRSDFDLGRLEVAAHRGFVFGTLAADPEPLADYLGPAAAWLDAHVDRYPGGALQVAPASLKLEFAANWKLIWDNAADGLHATFAHRSYNTLGRSAETETVLARNPVATPMVSYALPRGHSVVDQRAGIPDGPWATQRPLPTSDPLLASLRERGRDQRAQLDLASGNMVNVSLFPGLLFIGNQLLTIEPISVNRTRMHLFLTLAPQADPEVNLLRLRLDEDFVSFGTPDDLEMYERIQEGLAIPEEEWVDISRGTADVTGPDGITTSDIASEAPIRGYLKEWERLMNHPQATEARRSEPAGVSAP